MDNVNLRNVDLNLLVVLDVLLDERHVTRSARRLGLSQSATSNALGRLRDLFDDPLFVRGPGGMLPTPRAMELQGPVREALRTLRDALHRPLPFAPRSSDQRFVIGLSDYVGQLLVPAFTARVATEAPGVDLAFIAHRNQLDVEGLAAGAPDVSIGFFFDPPAALDSVALWPERFACLCRPEDAREGLTLQDYVALPHVLVSQTHRRQGHVDRLLLEHGLHRRVRTTVPHFSTVGPLLRAAGGIATLPERLARELARTFGLAVHPFPLAHPTWSLAMVWHRRNTRETAQVWLREQIQQTASASA